MEIFFKVAVAKSGVNLYATKIGKVAGYNFVNNKKVSYDFEDVLFFQTLRLIYFLYQKLFQMA